MRLVEDIYKNDRNQLVSIIKRYTRNDIEDLLNDIFIRLLKKESKSEFVSRCEFMSYFTVCVRNMVIDRYRRNGDYEITDDSRINHSKVSCNINPTVIKDFKTIIVSLNLNEREQKLIEFLLDDTPNSEISKFFNEAESSTRVRISKLRNKLSEIRDFII